MSILSYFRSQIDETENLPQYLCDSCIIQLNVAYSFKRSAIESDIKIRQYIIEYGMTINQYPLLNSNNLLLPANNFLAPPSPSSSSGGPNGHVSSNDRCVNGSSSGSNSGHADDQSSTQAVPERRPFPVMPFIIKEEPIDFETLSDITIETNTEAFAIDDRTNGRAELTPIANGRNKTPSTSSMVTLNDKSLLISTTRSDTDYISAYLPPPSTSEHSPVESTSSSVQIVPEIKLRAKTDESKPRPTRKSNNESPVKKISVRQGLTKPASPLKRTRSSMGALVGKRRSNREAAPPASSNSATVTATTPNTAMDKDKRRSVRETNNSSSDGDIDQKPNAKSLQRQLNHLQINMLTNERSPVRFDQRGSRTKEGVLPTKDYRKYYRLLRPINPLNKAVQHELKQQMSRPRFNRRAAQTAENGGRIGSVRTQKVFEVAKRSPINVANVPLKRITTNGLAEQPVATTAVNTSASTTRKTNM